MELDLWLVGLGMKQPKMDREGNNQAITHAKKKRKFLLEKFNFRSTRYGRCCFLIILKFLSLIDSRINFNLLTFVIKFSYRPGISTQFVKETLAFADVGKCVEWLTSLGVVFLSTDMENVDCKTSMSALTAL